MEEQGGKILGAPGSGKPGSFKKESYKVKDWPLPSVLSRGPNIFLGGPILNVMVLPVRYEFRYIEEKTYVHKHFD